MGLRLDKPITTRNSFRRPRFVSASLRSTRSHLNNNSDAYILRQVASRRNEYDLQQKIDLEIKMREGTAKLLAACKHVNQSLEAAKSLLTSDTRLAEFRKELQIKKSGINKNKSRKTVIHHGNASVSEIRIPLIWKETEYFKGKGDYRRFAVFCLLQVGSEIYDTVMVNVDRNVTDICFDDTFNFHKVQPDFQFKLSVYARLIHEDLSMAPTHKKFAQKISSSVSRSLGRRFSHMKDDFDSESGPKFYLMATATLNLKDASDAIKTHDLTLENVDKNLQLPLFGDFCSRFAVQPECQLREFISGLVTYKEGTIVKIDFSLYWCSLKNFKLHLWPVREELRNEPIFVKHTIGQSPASIVIPINKGSKLSQQSDLVNISNDDKCHYLKMNCTNAASDWYRSLISCKEAFIAWEPISEYQMDLAPLSSSSSSRSNYYLPDRLPGTLYDQTPIQGLKKRHSKSLSNVSSLETKYNSFVKGSNGTMRNSKLISN